MAKKAAVKKEATKVDTIEDFDDDLVVTTPITKNDSDPLDDDPFSSGTEGAVIPKRVEPEDILAEGDDEGDDFGQGFLQKDKEISDALSKNVEAVDSFDEAPSKNTIPGETVTEVETLKEENIRLKKELESLPKLSPVTISDQFDQLYQTLKEGRAAELLRAVQTDYLDLKYNSYTDKQKKEIELILKDVLRERFEGKVKAAKLINKAQS